MLTTHFIHLAIEPVTTTIGLVALGKIFGAGVAGGTAGSAIVQKVKRKKVNWGKAVTKGLESVDDVSQFLSGVSDTASLMDSSRSDKRLILEQLLGKSTNIRISRFLAFI